MLAGNKLAADGAASVRLIVRIGPRFDDCLRARRAVYRAKCCFEFDIVRKIENNGVG